MFFFPKASQAVKRRSGRYTNTSSQIQKYSSIEAKGEKQRQTVEVVFIQTPHVVTTSTAAP